MPFVPFNMKAKKIIILILASLSALYLINLLNATWHTIGVMYFPDNYSLTKYSVERKNASPRQENRKDGNYWIYTEPALIPSFIPQDLYILNDGDGDLTIWYGGRLSTFPQWPQKIIEWAQLGETETHDITGGINQQLRSHGFLKLFRITSRHEP